MKPADVLKDLDKALKKFGTYDYYDKGVDEVVDVCQVVTHVKSLPSKDAIEFLIELSKHEHGPHLVNHIVGSCDTDTTEAWFDEVVEGCRLVGLEVY